MALRSSNSLAFLALAAGCFATYATPPCALAGDKIEFSVPRAALQVPKVQSDDKETADSAREASLRLDTSALELQESSEQVVFFAAPKKKTDKTRDPTSMRDREDTSSEDGTYSDLDGLDDKTRSGRAATNLWDLEHAWKQDPRSTFAGRREENPAVQDDLHARLDSLSSLGNNAYKRDERFYRDSPDSLENTTWVRNLFNHGLSGMTGTSEGRTGASHDDVKPASQWVGQTHAFSTPYSAADDLLRDSKLPPGMVEYNLQIDTLRGRTPEETPGARLTFQLPELKPVTQNSDPYARQEPPASPPGQVQSRPAILPFPKRPGSVFQ